jgi:1-deoxyxylulose-5-phosphate synthase
VIATKVFGPMRSGPNSGGLSRKTILTEVENSLTRLGTDYIDLYQIHRWDPATPVEETLAALDALVASGKVRYLGASSMYAWQFAKALFTADLRGHARFTSMQNHYNLLNREEEREMLPLCADQRVAVIPWSPLARGRLARPAGATTARTADDAFGDSLYAGTEEADRRIVDAVAKVAAELDAPMASVALAWLLRNPVVVAPVVGVTKPHHLDDALSALDLSLTDDQVSELEFPYVPHRVAGFE